MKYISKAYWPKDAGLSLGNTECSSTDTHRSRAEAESVCRSLEKYGFGCGGNIFPVKTEVIEQKEPNQ